MRKCYSVYAHISCLLCFLFFFFNDTATTEIYTLSLHDALPILGVAVAMAWDDGRVRQARGALGAVGSHPVDITPFLAPLQGALPTENLIAEVAEAADKPSRPLDNTDLSHYWRKRMTKVYIERALRDACRLEPLGGRLTAQVRGAPGNAPSSP